MANDLSASAVEAMKLNVSINGLTPTPAVSTSEDAVMKTESASEAAEVGKPEGHTKRKTWKPFLEKEVGKVRVNEGDAW